MMPDMAEQNPPKENKAWLTQAMGDAGHATEEKISDDMLEEEAVVLVYGDNMFGDPVYSYIKFSLRNFQKMRDAMIAGENFKPSDYGEVIAAGRGDPNQELRDEMRVQYGLVDTPRPVKLGAVEPQGLIKPSFFSEDEGF